MMTSSAASHTDQSAIQASSSGGEAKLFQAFQQLVEPFSVDEDALKADIAAISADLEAFIDTIIIDAPMTDQQLVEAMRYALLGAGKRMRPYLLIKTADMFQVPRDQSLRVAVAIEAIHAYSLVHDDLPAMDDDDLRRGKPTVHKAFDEATAILAGDALQTLAFEILADAKTCPDAAIRCSITALFAKSAGYQGMAGGQMIDLLSETHEYDLEGVSRLQAMKTGALLEASVLAGALLGQASDADQKSLKDYSAAIGLSYQIIDDLLDVFGSEELVGKAVRKDVDAGKATFVGLMGIEKAQEKAILLTKAAHDSVAGFGGKAKALTTLASYIISRQY